DTPLSVFFFILTEAAKSLNSNHFDPEIHVNDMASYKCQKYSINNKEKFLDDLESIKEMILRWKFIPRSQKLKNKQSGSLSLKHKDIELFYPLSDFPYFIKKNMLEILESIKKMTSKQNKLLDNGNFDDYLTNDHYLKFNIINSKSSTILIERNIMDNLYFFSVRPQFI
ncbi:4054_t:CDS:1, partial [Dentiscutata heterogama]